MLDSLYPLSLDDLRAIAHLAGDISRKHFTHFGMLREMKGDRTPVTEADVDINDMFIRSVRILAPEIDIIGEEESSRKESEWCAVIDPIDGTFPYTWGAPIYTNMFGLMHRGRSVMGMISDPTMERIYFAHEGGGAFMNNKRLRVQDFSVNPTVGYASWAGSGNKMHTEGNPIEMQKVAYYLERHGISTVNFCSIGYLEAAVASGELAGVMFPGVAIHDTVPGDIIVREAGGQVTDLFGAEHDYLSGKINGHIMSNGLIHKILLDAVQYALI